MSSVIPESMAPTVAAVAVVVAVVGLFVAFWAVLRLRRVGRRLAALESSTPMAVPVDTARVNALASQLDTAVQRVGIVRYNPFEDTGSNQSFALAMLDARGDGFVMTSLHSRQATRLFLKQVSAGKADSAISDEEAEAIKQAATR
jgi:HAMP domain-containing protein